MQRFAAIPNPAAKPTLDHDILTELARHGETRNWEPGLVVVIESEPADSMYVVHEGELRVLVAGEGGRAGELSTMGPGDVFGELMLSGVRRSATVQTVTRAHRAQVTRAQVEELLQARPDLAMLLLQRLMGHVRKLALMARCLASMEVNPRVVGLFTSVAVDRRGWQCVLGLRQQRVAERVEALRAMVNRLLQDLERGSCIKQERGCIVLLRKLPPRW